MSTFDRDQALTREDVKEIIDLVERSHFGELRLEFGDTHIYLRKADERTVVSRDGPPSTGPAESTPVADDTRGSANLREDTGSDIVRQPPPQRRAGAGTAADDTRHLVTSPMVGIFYRASDPDQPPYVEVGAEVDTGDVVCLIEVMKLFNSVTTAVPGRVVEILVDNGATVEYGQPIVAIEPRENR